MENYLDAHVHRLKVVNFDASDTWRKSNGTINNAVPKTSTTKESHDEYQRYKIEVEKSQLRKTVHSSRIKEKQYISTTHDDQNGLKTCFQKPNEEKPVMKLTKLSSGSQRIPKFITKAGKVKFGGIKGQAVSGTKKQGSTRSYRTKHRRKSDVNELKLIFLRGGNTLLSSLHNFSKDVLKPNKNKAKSKPAKEPECKKEKKKEIKVLFSRDKDKNKISQKSHKTSLKMQNFDDVFGFRRNRGLLNYQSRFTRSIGRKRSGKTLPCLIKRSVSCEDQTCLKNQPKYSHRKLDSCTLHSVNLLRFPLEGENNISANMSTACLPSRKKSQSNIRCIGGSGDASKVCTQFCEVRTDKECAPCTPQPSSHRSIINDPCSFHKAGQTSKPKICSHSPNIPVYKLTRERESQGKKILKYVLFALIILSWAPCILVVLLCWLVSYPLRPHWIRAKQYKTQCYSGHSHRLQRYRCNKCTIPSGFWSSFINWIKNFKWTNTSPFEAISAMLKGDGTRNKIKVVPNPTKQYKLYHSNSKGWVMKPIRFPSICYQRQYQCTTIPSYHQNCPYSNTCREPPKKKRRKKKKSTKCYSDYSDPCVIPDPYRESKPCYDPDPCNNCKDNCRNCGTKANKYTKRCLNLKTVPCGDTSEYKVCIDNEDPCTMEVRESCSTAVAKPCAYDPYTGVLTPQPCRTKPRCQGCKISIAPTTCRKKKYFIGKQLQECKKCFRTTVGCGTESCCLPPRDNDPCKSDYPCNDTPCKNRWNPCEVPPMSLPRPNFLNTFLPPICKIQAPFFGDFNQGTNQLYGEPNVSPLRNPCGNQPVCGQPYSDLEKPVCGQPTLTKRCWTKVSHCVKNADKYLQRAHEQCLCNRQPKEPECWASKQCPTVYPLFQMWTQCITGCCHLCLYILSACVWCPPIICCYMCYDIWCACS